MSRHLNILGTRGVPARHGGFETFAERLALYLTGRGWTVTVYCQEEGRGPTETDEWQGVRRVRMPVSQQGALGTIVFDWASTRHVARQPGLILTLGYNTAIFSVVYRLRRRRNLINMDGIEWKRIKWSVPEKAWLYLNERMGCWLGNHLIADHPEIARHLETRVQPSKITMIPYGADAITSADRTRLTPYGLDPDGYALVIARPEPENSILEIVRGFSAAPRGRKLVVLGRYESEHPYHQQVLAAASPEVLFPGAIYDPEVVAALRFYATFYIHGHTVGGTNPSLVEALGAGLPVLAHNNAFNRWVAGRAGCYFTAADIADRIGDLLADEERLARMRSESRARFEEAFTWDRVLSQYEALLAQYA